jgi:hypothetical protein
MCFGLLADPNPTASVGLDIRVASNIVTKRMRD